MSRPRESNGPVLPVATPAPKDVGTLTRYTAEIIEGGPRALIAAEHKATKLSERFGVEIEGAWCLKTPMLCRWLGETGENSCDTTAVDQKLLKPDSTGDDRPSAMRKVTKLNCAHARYALRWRPRFLAVLSLTRSENYACRAARVDRGMVRNHRKWDPEFEAQCQEAEERAIELLHDATMKSAIEGDMKPVYWQGIRVGFIREYDNRLRIELLRAHMPKVFKTPGAKVAINTGTLINGPAMIVDSAEQDRLIALRQEALRKMQERKQLALSAEVSHI